MDIRAGSLAFKVLDEIPAHPHSPVFARASLCGWRADKGRKVKLGDVAFTVGRRPRQLFIHRVRLDPAWRGRGLGLHAVAGLIEWFGRDCDEARLIPGSIGGAPDEAAARRKIARHWRRLGFRRVGGQSGEYRLDLRGPRPTLGRAMADYHGSRRVA